ncbi:hypothetical protein A2164_02515 [Candidatus Curtissbacteria bacterium RBG_13_35_7]|uniref:Uncharacterized protein n=1 Tax=Candidatus Curtissbacteria bacterium RBG_13_35_7 TaxID=1797705 RepID=A0A1F5G303_9BACT|nr:MAG: hypothetical protein A2164_02515 [Candidatus Curtissbacteria bacterium RBG_13_35_7]
MTNEQDPIAKRPEIDKPVTPQHLRIVTEDPVVSPSIQRLLDEIKNAPRSNSKTVQHHRGMKMRANH